MPTISAKKIASKGSYSIIMIAVLKRVTFGLIATLI